jgi:hypothetical protein
MENEPERVFLEGRLEEVTARQGPDRLS